MSSEKRQTGSEVIEKRAPKIKRPTLFVVVLHNDDYTTMDFVVEILESVFQKSPAEAHRVMMKVHLEGRGTCGAYPYEVAETKVSLVHARAQEKGFPLRASIEEA